MLKRDLRMVNRWKSSTIATNLILASLIAILFIVLFIWFRPTIETYLIDSGLDSALINWVYLAIGIIFLIAGIGLTYARHLFAGLTLAIFGAAITASLIDVFIRGIL